MKRLLILAVGFVLHTMRIWLPFAALALLYWWLA